MQVIFHFHVFFHCELFSNFMQQTDVTWKDMIGNDIL